MNVCVKRSTSLRPTGNSRRWIPDLVIDHALSPPHPNTVKTAPTTTYQIDLPSGGVFYSGKRNITVSPFLADHILELHAAFGIGARQP